MFKKFSLLFAVGALILVSGCASLMEGQQKAADVAFGAVTSPVCRVVRANLLLEAAMEQWPAVNFAAVSAAASRMDAAKDLNGPSAEYAAAMIAALAPVFVELGQTVISTIEEGRAEGWTLDALVGPLMQINGVPQKLIRVRGMVAECEAVHGVVP